MNSILKHVSAWGWRREGTSGSNGPRGRCQFSHLPGKPSHNGTFSFGTLARTLTQFGAPWRYSDDCGLYVCESTYWVLLDHANQTGWPSECGFLHVPAISPAAPLARTIETIRQVVLDWLER